MAWHGGPVKVLLACEAAGFDVVLVETVGVGQSETAVADLVDMFLLLLLPSGGDELQGIKKGIMELADLIVVNKADGDLKDAAGRSAAEYASALRLLHLVNADWVPEVLTCSSLEGTGIPAIWERIGDFRSLMEETGTLDRKRAEQARRWMWGEVDENLLSAFRGHPEVRQKAGGTRSQGVPGAIDALCGSADVAWMRFRARKEVNGDLTGPGASPKNSADRAAHGAKLIHGAKHVAPLRHYWQRRDDG